MFIVDLVGAFWTIPLHLSEGRFFVAKLRGEFYMLCRTAQGSRAAPLTFAMIAGIAARFVQSIVANLKPAGLSIQERNLECRCMWTIHWLS